ncbi:hypothetical protein [Asanoa iriomotensis]|uniref:Exo-alpha-sialidase n=1 Tax=Asanoa iriomotensis TaxID=234613 RepID=A0ABQ4BY56_9ACTN|nr:hypothetical protein [Asanoa iriomotensis]GIF55443.1 hypothetical protein Air01nite_15380 [Asanoa iriomotensis]
MPDLDNRLARSRSALLDEIEQPPMAAVRRRASRIRRRRATTAGAAALAVLGVIAIGARPWQQDAGPTTVTATDPPAIAPVYRGGGIEIIGLSPTKVHEIDGDIADVEFTDPAHGIAMAGCDRDCPPPASTEDGGLSWHTVPMSPSGGDGPTDVTAFPGGHWLLRGGGSQWSSFSGVGWEASTPPAPTAQENIGPGQLPGIERAGGDLVVRSWDQGTLGPLVEQPDLAVRWVAPAPAGDGSWWVGGLSGTTPAVAVSHDAGRDWTTTVLDPPVGEVADVRIGTLGSEVYALATGQVGELLGVYHSADGGRTFTATYLSAGGGPGPDDKVPGGGVAGDPVPLLDGRLLVVERDGRQSSWWVSTDAGRTFSPVPGLPAAGSIRRTYAGYVVYGLFQSSWAAFSTDGSNWQKLQLF